MFLKRKMNDKLNLLLDLFGLCYKNGNSAFVQNFNEEINTQMRKILMDTDIRFRVKEELDEIIPKITNDLNIIKSNNYLNEVKKDFSFILFQDKSGNVFMQKDGEKIVLNDVNYINVCYKRDEVKKATNTFDKPELDITY